MITKKFCLMCLIAVLALLPCLVSVSPAASPIAADQEKQIRDLVDSAVKLIKARGETAFAELNVKNGPWHKGETAIFVTGETGVEMVNAAQPELVGKNLWNVKGTDGKLTVQEQWKIVKANGGGWMDSTWVKPGTDKSVPCRVFVQAVRIKDKPYMVGAAYYLQ